MPDQYSDPHIPFGNTYGMGMNPAPPMSLPTGAVLRSGSMMDYLRNIPQSAGYLMRSLAALPTFLTQQSQQDYHPGGDAADAIETLGVTPQQAMMNKTIDPRARLALMMQNQISPQMVMGDRLFRRGRNTAQPGTTQNEFASVAP